MERVSPVRVASIVFLASFVSACGKGAATSTATPSGAPAAAASGLPESYFPLEEGKIYHYVTTEAGETGMLVAKVHRSSAAHGELRLSNATKRFVVSSEGVAYEGGAFLLKAPLSLGASWAGEHGGTTTIVALDESVEVPAGRYASCLRTLEEGGRPPGARYETIYCPGVGMVRLVVTSGDHEARAELKSYGAPVSFE